MPTNVASTGLARDLAARGERETPIRIGLVGAGETGADALARAAVPAGGRIAALMARQGAMRAVPAPDLAGG